MARYIDADKFLKDQIRRCGCVPLVGVSKYINGEESFEGDCLDALINEQPTADVVEKSLFDELKCLIEKIDIKSDDYNAKYGADYAKKQVLTLISEFIKIKVDGRRDT
jgi:hypothetical protein